MPARKSGERPREKTRKNRKKHEFYANFHEKIKKNHDKSYEKGQIIPILLTQIPSFALRYPE